MPKRSPEQQSTRRNKTSPTMDASNAEVQPADDSGEQQDSQLSTPKIAPPDLFGALLSSFESNAKPTSEASRDELLRRFLDQEVAQHPVCGHYNLLILFDKGTMIKDDADYIYAAVESFGKTKPVLLVLYSNGGDIGSAYLIGQLCREYAKGRFVVAVPRQAKSSATLLSCAADEIHMGSLSELGPIDPQIEDMPALGLKASVDHICDLVAGKPHASEMFAMYLNLSLDPVQLGYYERVAESAAQYAERLLQTHSSALASSPTQIAKTLVYSYKDHGFVIDKGEARRIFGSKIIKVNTPEYDLANAIYRALDMISSMAHYMGHYFHLIGSLHSRPVFIRKDA